MHVSRALLKNTKASLHFHRRFFIFLVALLIIVVALIAVAASLPQIITAGNTDTGIGTSGYASGAYIFETHTDHEGSPTPTPTPNVTFPPLVDAPEYGIGGGLVALFICFAAFTVYMKRAKPSQKLA